MKNWKNDDVWGPLSSMSCTVTSKEISEYKRDTLHGNVSSSHSFPFQGATPAHLVDTSPSCTFHTVPPGTMGQVTWQHEDHWLQNQTGLDSKQDATTGLPQSCEAIFTLPVPVSSPVHGASITYLRGLLQGDRNVRKAPGTWYVVVTQGITIIITVIKLTAGILFSLS